MKKASKISPRIREALIAAGAALILLLAMITWPIDQTIWILQSRLASFEASGEIGFVGAEEDLANPAFPERRLELAMALDQIAKSDVERVYIDVVFTRPSTADHALRAAMERLGDRLYLVTSYETGPDGKDHLRTSLKALSEGLNTVGKSNLINSWGYVWNAPFTMEEHGSAQVSLPVSMATDTSPSKRGNLPINYSFRLSSIPTFSIGDLVSTPSGSPPIIGAKVLLIGNADETARDFINIPGYIDVPSSIAQIYAAETLKAGKTLHINAFTILTLCIAITCAALVSPWRHLSRRIVITITICLITLALIASSLGIRVDIASSLAFLTIYALIRAKNAWQNRIEMIDTRTGLPTFTALEANDATAHRNHTLIVGKIHRLEDVKRTLPEDLHGEYINKVVERLRLKSEDQTFYIDKGHCLAWCFPERDPGLIQDHLEGLRALLSAPLQVGGKLVDIGMTFSFDVSPSENMAKRISAAVAVVEQTTEAHNPITATAFTTEEDLLWNISLQARIDAALGNGEIYLAYQPKILIETGDMIGVEALVRWKDPQRGHIPPDLFIRQCESVGRMMDLTKFVLRHACLAGQEFQARGRLIPVAVNISATLLHNREIVSAVHEVLRETGFDPALLTLEVTETYRISSLEKADGVLHELLSIGLKISMDDFGVGAASFEALLHLPFSELKIDRLFVSRIVDDAKARSIVGNVLRMGKELRIIVVAEGVETAATLALLKKLGCVVAQGFGLAMPMLAKEVFEFQAPERILTART